MHSQMVSATDSRADRLRRAAGRRVEPDLVFGLSHDLGHHRDRLDRVFARRGLAREHHRVGAVVDRVGHVGCLRPRGPRILDHRLQHLRRRDHRLAILRSAADDVLLDRRHLLRRHLHAQVAARHHDRRRPTSRIESRCSIACGFSSLAMIQRLDSQGLQRAAARGARRPRCAQTRRQSRPRPAPTANSRSSSSFFGQRRHLAPGFPAG